MHLPWVLNFFFKAISPFLDPVTRDKVRVLTSIIQLRDIFFWLFSTWHGLARCVERVGFPWRCVGRRVVSSACFVRSHAECPLLSHFPFHSPQPMTSHQISELSVTHSHKRELQYLGSDHPYRSRFVKSLLRFTLFRSILLDLKRLQLTDAHLHIANGSNYLNECDDARCRALSIRCFFVLRQSLRVDTCHIWLGWTDWDWDWVIRWSVGFVARWPSSRC